MPFLVQGCIDYRKRAVTTDTAKEAFAKAIEWRVVDRFTDIFIYDGVRSYSIDEFASVMALHEIATTIENAALKAANDDA